MGFTALRLTRLKKAFSPENGVIFRDIRLLAGLGKILVNDEASKEARRVASFEYKKTLRKISEADNKIQARVMKDRAYGSVEYDE